MSYAYRYTHIIIGENGLMHKVVSKRNLPIVPMDSNSKKCRKRGKRGSNKRRKRKVDRKIDYISDLPEPVLHQILSKLHRKDAARTCILSKRWRQVWNSYQVLDFDLLRDNNGSKEMYAKQIYGSLGIQKFRLCFAKGVGLTIQDANDWLVAAVERKVRDLEVQVKSQNYYVLPSCVMSGSSITALNLFGCDLLLASSISLPKLQKLSLKCMHITPLILQRIISGCPLIEDLRLIKCSGLIKLTICNLDRLRRVDLHKCHLLDSIVIVAQSLETFWYYNDSKKLCHINLEACRALKELIMEYPRMTDMTFHDQIMGFQELEKLVLSRCNGLKSIHLTGDTLKKLVIRRCRNLEKVLVDTPNLTSLEFTGQRLPFSLLSRLCLKKAFLSFEPSLNGAAKLNNLFEKIDFDTGLKYLTLNKVGIVLYEDIRAMLLPLRHISKPRTVRISMRFQDLLDEALKISPFPPTLSVMSHSSSDFPKIICKELKREKLAPQCCGCFANKCWRHYLKNVSFENWIYDSIEISRPSPALVWRHTTLMLDWRH